MKNLSWLPVLVILIFLFLSFFSVLKVKSEYLVSPKIVGQGEVLTITSDYCKRLPLAARYQIVYIGELYHPAPEVYSSNATWGCNTSRFNFTVPENLPSGKYHLELIVSYPPFLRELTFKSEDFEVIEKKSINRKLDDIISRLDEWEEIK